MKASVFEESKRMKVYYDAQCVVCAKEIEMYMKKDLRNLISYVDISSPCFDAKSEGLDPDEVERVFHVKGSDGEVHTGVDGFVAIWDELEIFSPLARLAKSSLFRPLFDLGYISFSKVRPYLPRKKCDDGSCKI